MANTKSDFDWQKHAKAAKPLDIIIVGAGIAGLAAGLGFKQTGHTVTILEQVHEIAEVGAGIQVAPNAARILDRFGILEEVLEDATLLEKNSLRRYADDEKLGTAPLMPEIGEKYGAPLSVIHRGDLQRILLNAAKKAGVDIRTATKVVEVDPNLEACVKTKEGEWISGDVIIAADGIKSSIRGQIAAHHGHKDFSSPTGDAAYRVMIPRKEMEHDERALDLLNHNIGMRWMGPGGHIMAYPVKRNTVYNMVLLHPAKPQQSSEEESWTTKGDKKEMMAFYKDWSPLVQDLLSYVPEGEVMEWTLNSHKPLPSWIENKVALIGDSSHPMLPYVAQGAANAIEDAGVLVAAFTQTDDVTKALQVYQEVRKARGEKIQQSADTTRRSLHLPDGPEQRQRDDAIRAAARGEGSNPDLWADEGFQRFMWGVDVMGETVERWEELLSKARGHHLHGVGASTYV